MTCMSLQSMSQAPARFGFHHIVLPAPQRWGCQWRGRGTGVVIARTELSGTPTIYDVMLANGTVGKALAADVQPALAPVAS